MNLLQPKALEGGQSIAAASVLQDSPKVQEPLQRPRVILAIDRPGWAFHHIAQQLERHLGEFYDFKIVLYGECQHETADLLISFWWKELPKLLADNFARRSMLCLYDHYSWHCSPYDVSAFEFALKKADAVAVGNLEIANMIRIRGLATKPIYLCEDGVDCAQFAPRHFLPSLLTLGWCGNSKAAHGGIKGLRIIQAAVKKAKDVQLITLDASDKTGLVRAHEDMPAWYGALSAYICASSHEGTPNPVLEALACGRPVITTRCGLAPRLIVDGVNGFFCERSVDGLVAAIDRLRETDQGMLGKAARLSAEMHSWEYKAIAWRMAIEGALARWL